jgi:hypothetical protein
MGGRAGEDHDVPGTDGLSSKLPMSPPPLPDAAPSSCTRDRIDMRSGCVGQGGFHSQIASPGAY